MTPRLPPRYQPARTAAELITRYRAGERRFPNTELSDEVIEESMPGIDLSDSTLRVVFSDVDLAGSKFVDADLAFTHFDANLTRARFDRAELAWANFGWSNLSNASLTRAHLRHCVFESARLDGCNFTGATLDNTSLLDVSIESLSSARDVIHQGPSYVDHRTVLHSTNSPSLRDCLLRMGTPPLFVEYMIQCATSMTNPARGSLMQSTFISFGEPDRVFARRLYESLHTNGVNTFFFPEHALPGKKLHRVMREGVNQYDRVILICSESSFSRKGLLNEIEETLQREARDGGKTYLLPIRLDDYVLSDRCTIDPGMLQAIRDRVVADFTGIDSDRARYDRALQQLLAALKREDFAGA
jgi:hypothetical protein